ncbi:hypothetical protein IWX76_002507 [Pedobacter sp. CAN_A7]
MGKAGEAKWEVKGIKKALSKPKALFEKLILTSELLQ